MARISLRIEISLPDHRLPRGVCEKFRLVRPRSVQGVDDDGHQDLLPVESERWTAVESHICQNRADMGHPSFVTDRDLTTPRGVCEKFRLDSEQFLVEAADLTFSVDEVNLQDPMPLLTMLIQGTHREVALRMNVERYLVVGNLLVWEVSN